MSDRSNWRVVVRAMAGGAFSLALCASAALAAATEIKGAAILDHPCGKVSAKQLPAMPTFQADDIIPANRLTHRHRWSSLDGFCCRRADLTERLMDGRDQGRKLIGADLITPDIGGHYFCRELEVVLFVGHFAFPHSCRKNTIPGQL